MRKHVPNNAHNPIQNNGDIEYAFFLSQGIRITLHPPGTGQGQLR